MKIDKDQFVLQKSVPESKFYTVSGSEDFLDEQGFPRTNSETNAFAKAIKNKPSKHIVNSACAYRFYIKTDPNNIIVDPVKLYTTEQPKSSFINKVCKNTSGFTEVSESVFNKYIQYLQTHQDQWLVSAQREIR
jgi:hypothetical protein